MRYLIVLMLSGAAFAQTPKAPSGICVDDVCPPPVVLKVDFQGDFDTCALSREPFALHINGASNALTVQSAPSRSGACALKAYITRVNSGHYRAEAITQAHDPVWGEDTWYAFSLYLPSDYKVDPLSEILAQWHHHPDSGEPYVNPPMAITLKNGMFGMSSRWNQTDKPYQNSSGSWVYTGSRSHPNLWTQAESLGKWTDIALRVRWNWQNTSSPGYTLYKNGVKILDVAGPVGYKDARPPDFRVGLYKSLWKFGVTSGITVRVLYYDEVRMVRGGTFDAVQPPTLRLN